MKINDLTNTVNININKYKDKYTKRDKEPPKYGLLLYILFFFTFAFIGWIWEISLHVVTSGELINRGVLLGPWLPIYGTGGVLVLILLRKFYENPVLTFVFTMIVCSVVEYFTSWYLEITKGVRWWDYSGYFLNINGRICLLGAIVFGIGGCAIIYVLAPFLKKIYSKLPVKLQIIICILLISVFAVDLVHSKDHPNIGKGVTDYNKWKEKDQTVISKKIQETISKRKQPSN